MFCHLIAGVRHFCTDARGWGNEENCRNAWGESIVALWPARLWMRFQETGRYRRRHREGRGEPQQRVGMLSPSRNRTCRSMARTLQNDFQRATNVLMSRTHCSTSQSSSGTPTLAASNSTLTNRSLYGWKQISGCGRRVRVWRRQGEWYAEIVMVEGLLWCGEVYP